MPPPPFFTQTTLKTLQSNYFGSLAKGPEFCGAHFKNYKQEGQLVRINSSSCHFIFASIRTSTSITEVARRYADAPNVH